MIRLSFLGVIHKIFQLTGAKHAKTKLAGKSYTKFLLTSACAIIPKCVSKLESDWLG